MAAAPEYSPLQREKSGPDMSGQQITILMPSELPVRMFRITGRCWRENVSPHPDPAQLLVEFLPVLPKGKALDVAMGKGRNALFLASHGFDVVGLEKDEESIDVCKTDAKERGINPEIRSTTLEDL